MLNTYNGWSGRIRTVRGQKFYALLKEGRIPPLFNCSLCGGNGGLTYHAEEYGSTWEDYLQSTHSVCAYCHGLIHLRFKYPNRWRRHLAQIGRGEKSPISYESLSQFFAATRSMLDCESLEATRSGVQWADSLPTAPVALECLKVALVKMNDVTFRPDPTIYSDLPNRLTGLRYDHVTAQLYRYSYGENDLLSDLLTTT